MRSRRDWRALAGPSRWRFPGSRPARGVIVYLALALFLTALTATLRSCVVIPAGLVRTVYPSTDFSGEPLLQDLTTKVSLEFLDDDPELPRRSFSVCWRGFWFLPEEQTIDLYAGADDRVDVLVDSRLVHTRSFRVGMQTSRQRVTLGAGPHEVVIRYVQHGGGRGLNVQWALPGFEPAALPPRHLFPERPDNLNVMIATGTLGLTRVVVFVWLAALGVWVIRSAPPAFRRWRSVAAPRTPQAFARRLGLVAAPALLAPMVLFLLGPYTIYGGNRAEFSVPIADLAWPWLLLTMAVAWGLLLAVGCVVCFASERAARTYSALLLACGLLLWAQGNVLVAEFGLLYGERLNLAAHDGRIPYELTLWVVVPALAVAFARPVSKVAPFASRIFVLIQLAALGLSMLSSPAEARRTQDEWRSPPDQLYRLSRTRNVLHIVLDGFLSELFGEALRADRAAFDRDFPGFIFFADHLGAFPTTRASMPAMLTGIPYRNQVPFDQFLDRTAGQRSIASVLAAHGYAVRSISFHPGDHPRTLPAGGPGVSKYTIPTPYGSYEDYVRFTALQIFDLSLFRHVPQALKAYVYNDESWLVQHYVEGSLHGQRPRTFRPSNHTGFMEELTGRLTVTEDAPVYTFIHVAIPHPPVVLDGDCTFIGPKRLTRSRFAGQSRCALRMVGHLLDRLRGLGVYDRTAIVLTADHGWRLERRDHPLRDSDSPAGPLDLVALSAMPLLAVKPMAAHGPLGLSMAPTAITDVPATITDLAGLPPGLFPGESALRLDEHAPRRRTYAFHSWRNADWGREYMDVLYLFSVDGPVLDPDSWSFQKSVAEPAGREASGR